MVQSVIQTSFHAGEWAPALNARVDLAKYRAGAALLRNFFVDYRGGASTRPGTEWIAQALVSDHPVRLIPFQASNDVGYVLEFGNFYARFIFQGSLVFRDGDDITDVTTGSNVITVSNDVQTDDWIYVSDVVGISNINNRYFIVESATPTTITVTDLFSNPVSFTGTYVSGGGAGFVYILSTPYAAEDLALLKFTQLVDKLILCHPDYPPHVLTLIESSNWTLTPINFGSNVSTPGITGITTTNPGVGNYAYVVTAVDINGQESVPTAVVTQSINAAAGQFTTITISWSAVSGATSYNIYRTTESIGAAPPAGSAFGFLTNVTGTSVDDSFTSNSAQNATDFSISPQIPKNPFQGAGVSSITLTSAGTYTSVPSVVLDPAPSGGLTATAAVKIGIVATGTIGGGGTGFAVGNIFQGKSAIGSPTLQSTAVDGSGHVTAVSILNPGTVSSGSTPSNPVTFEKVSGAGASGFITVDLTWGVTSISISQSGYGYTSVPAVTFSAGAATATAVLEGGTGGGEDSTGGNPAVPGIFQQRLVLAAKPRAVQTFEMSQPGSYFNFNISNPIQADDAITGSLSAGQLNEIKSMVSVPTGLMVLTDRANWLISAGSGLGGGVSAIDITAHAHSFNGASDVPPIIAGFDILFVQAKNSIVRDLAFNFYTQIYTGTDISILSSHLFFNYTMQEWAWAEEPFKVVWVVRNDGVMLAMTFLKEQELIGWTHHDTQGLFQSVATVTEVTPFTNSSGLSDRVYVVVERVINGNTVKYIERFNQRSFDDDALWAWCVDTGIRYVGPPVTNFSNAEHLAGATVTGLADGIPITPFVMPASGDFTLPTPASNVTIGLPFVAQLQTLRLDTGEPTIQGKRKGINGVTVRVQQTLGLKIGRDFDNLVVMKDLARGNIGSASNGVVTELITGDARTIIDPSWDVQGQYCIQQDLPLPATILGVIPEIGIGDTK